MFFLVGLNTQRHSVENKVAITFAFAINLIPQLMKEMHSYLKTFCVLVSLFAGTFLCRVNAQTGYIYVHKKALDESSSLDFAFNVTGGVTPVSTFSLNDKPTQTQLADIGSSRSGRLWAVTTGGRIFYRALNSSSWSLLLSGVQNGVLRVDGGNVDTLYYTTSTGVYVYDGTTSTLIYSGATHDIASGWDNLPYIVDNSGNIQRYSGSGTVWNSFYTGGFVRYIDVSPATGNVYAIHSSLPIAYEITPAGVVNSMTSPSDVTINFNDIAADALGNVFISAYSNTAVSSQVYKWAGGTAWNAGEPTANYSTMITGGLGGQMWAIIQQQNYIAYDNIFSRSLAGSNAFWIDDERVRSVGVAKGNSQMIAVAPGTYTITEVVPSGWDLNKVTVFDPNSSSTSNVNANTATLTVAANEVVHVIFQDEYLQPFAMTNSCSAIYTENFGTGTTGTYGPAFVGQTPYHYLGDITPGGDGYYKLVSQAFPDFNTWQAIKFYDHTSNNGSGRMLAVNAAYDQNEFFRRRFTNVIPGATYNFSAWIANLTPTAPIKPNVTFQVVDPSNNSVMASSTTGNLTGTTTQWAQYSLSFMATDTTIDLMLVNNNIGGNGNDLAIDDISFSLSPVPAPITTVVNTGCGTPGSITVIFPLGATYEYSMDSFATAAHSNPVFGGLAAGIYTTSVRFVGTVNCFRSKTDTVTATLCGNIWDDGNGDAVNNSENPMTSGVWVNAVNPITNAVVQSVQIDASGNYSISGLLPNTSYNFILSNASQAVNTNLTSATLPTNYVATGVNLNGVANTTNKTGIINVNTGSGNLTLQNWAIEKTPDADSKSQLISQPSGTTINAGAVNTAVSGKDLEDGTLGNSNTIVITTVPANATLLYNGVAVTAGQQITGFNPLLVSFTGVNKGSLSVTFNYGFIDAAGQQSVTPATFNIYWLSPLPINLESFIATAKDCKTVTLSWKVSSAVDFSKFQIERSINGIDFIPRGVVNYINTISNYDFAENALGEGNYQYRLKMIDANGHSSYSPIVYVRLDCDQQRVLLVYPNPAKNNITINGLNAGEQIGIYDALGQMVQTKKATMYQLNIDLTNLANGTYFIIVTNEKGEKIVESKIAKIN